MVMKKLYNIFFLSIISILISASLNIKAVDNTILMLNLQRRVASEKDSSIFIMINETQKWNSTETAVIICDMWDKHWCKGATGRVVEMAPFMNEVISLLRNSGVMIVHAPSDCMDSYSDHPGRKRALDAKSDKLEKYLQENRGILPAERSADWPLEVVNDGCWCADEICTVGRPWIKQTDQIIIKEEDIISDSGVEIAGIFKNSGIKNVILMGVHTNMCVMNRSFGLRNMVRLGFNVVLMRDLTDTMYSPEGKPYVSHFTGNELMFEYIEKYICPTVISSDITCKRQFRFKEDNRKRIAFIMAEGEYRSNQRFPELAKTLNLKYDLGCDFAIGKPVMQGEGRHNIANLQILQDADLMVIMVRRRALDTEKMEFIRNYIENGKPVFGMRTASHAFDAKQPVFTHTQPDDPLKRPDSVLLEQWPEFDQEVLGGNYQDHYGNREFRTIITIIPGMGNHPLLQGVKPEGFQSRAWLYKNDPLRSDKVQVLLIGTIPDQPSHPVLWTNKTKYGNDVVYTSLGHWDDWEINSFMQIVLNSIEYLLKL